MAALLRPFSEAPPGRGPAARVLAGLVAAALAGAAAAAFGVLSFDMAGFDIGSSGGRKLAALILIVAALIWFALAGPLYRTLARLMPAERKD